MPGCNACGGEPVSAPRDRSCRCRAGSRGRLVLHHSHPRGLPRTRPATHLELFWVTMYRVGNIGLNSHPSLSQTGSGLLRAGWEYRSSESVLNSVPRMVLLAGSGLSWAPGLPGHPQGFLLADLNQSTLVVGRLQPASRPVLCWALCEHKGRRDPA